MTSARRSGIVNRTPSTPPLTQIRKDCQKGKPGPPPDDHQSRQHEDDGGQGAGRGGDGLDDVVLEDRRVLEGAEDRHRDHRRGDRRRDGESYSEAEVDIGSGERNRDQGSEEEPPAGSALVVAWGPILQPSGGSDEGMAALRLPKLFIHIKLIPVIPA